MHIGVGNFHRAHQAFYINRLLENKDQSQWGICGVGLLASDKNIVHKLQAQNLEYTLTICGRDGVDEVYNIGSMTDIIWGYQDPQKVIDKIAESNIKIITLTITEGGYNLDKVSGKFNLEDESIDSELKNKNNPKTVFGLIAHGLQKRKELDHGGLTILSCDNLQHNGDTAKKAFLTFIKAFDHELADWTEAYVSFPNSMVDRITPATTVEDVIRLNKQSGMKDDAPVYCEDFSQWVIEDNFVAGRPALERVGVEFTDQVDIYENMKLSLLNASHILLSYPSFLIGHRKVDKALNDDSIYQLVRNFMDIDIAPYVPAPPKTDLELYKKTLLQRFANHSVSDQLSRLCFDGISKFPVYIIPNLMKMVADDKDLSRVAFLVACYRHYLKYKIDNLGHSYDIAEPWLSDEDNILISNDDPLDFLDLSIFKKAKLKETDRFASLYKIFANRIKSEGVSPVLESVLV